MTNRISQKNAEVVKLELAAVYEDYEAIKSQLEVDSSVEHAKTETPDIRDTGKTKDYKKRKKDLQHKIDYWVESKTREKLTLLQLIVLLGSMFVIVLMFAFQQRLPMLLGKLPAGTGRTVYFICHFAVLILPAISAACTSIANIAVKRYDRAIELLCEKEQKIFKRSAAYQNKIAWKTIAEALTIITAFIAAISLIKV